MVLIGRWPDPAISLASRHGDVGSQRRAGTRLRPSGTAASGPCNAVTPSARTSRTAAHPSPPAGLPPLEPPPKKRLAVFVSGGGSNFRAIHAAFADGGVHGEVAVVVSNSPSCSGVAYAQSHGIPTLTYPAPKADSAAGLTDAQLVAALTEEHQADIVILAGYLKLIPQQLVRAYKRRIVNIHPALLPSFGGKGYYGIKVHQAVVASGARFSGPTIHFVDEEYDTGPILAQAVVPVYPTDRPEQLAARVLKEEHKLYPQCVAALCEDRVTWRHDGVPIMWRAH
ncbi:Phosphoribosylglycinamide chloroplastic [Micractinium conductrix]|uniref:phosphoribosylglycinamide formyltransferase 1 n=1 Tax=Micractinium conductrix TaxID=554055 RepID=A0A2P6VLY6_9CHLO|nr:Phosphoribosylglycinamide chloroplastic [Micractinium conductrix]|eukprot:PSC75099.1 Phosphoribosylglycinamide chloroplastic [Micractinium conductrix]